MKLEQVKVSDLKRLEKNVRRHSDIQIRELIKSYEQFGQTRAIVIDENNNILIGNGLHMALEKKGVENCTVYRKKGLSEKDKKKLVLTDNKTYSLGADDFPTIEEYIKDITSEGDYDIAGFDSEFIRQITKELEEITNDVQEYGIISLDDKKKLEEKAAQSPINHSQKEEANNSSEFSNTLHQEKDTEPIEHNKQQETIYEPKTCVCPNCGEVIPFD